MQRCKGMRDLSPDQMTAFRFIDGVFRDSCLKWGYREIKTPTIEYLHLFTSAGRLTPETLGRVYSFLDWDGWSGERVVLRPDGTIPVARMYIENIKSGLARLSYLANIFVFEGSGKESRERWQCGAELIGPDSRTADAELISLSLEVLGKLKIGGVELRLSHAGFIRSLLTNLGVNPEEQSRALGLLVEGKAEGLSGITKDTREIGKTLLPLLNLQTQSPGYLNNLKALIGDKLPEVGPQLDEFIELVNLLEELGYPYRIDVPSGSAFEYYTGAIFQIYVGGEKIGGGGRYNALIPAMGGGAVPASGFALYLDRLMRLLKPEICPRPAARVLIKNRASGLKAAFQAARQLREAGYAAELDLDGQADCIWTLEVRENGQLFLKGQDVNLATVAMSHILTSLEDAGAD